jgi:hypothetical protein
MKMDKQGWEFVGNFGKRIATPRGKEIATRHQGEDTVCNEWTHWMQLGV